MSIELLLTFAILCQYALFLNWRTKLLKAWDKRERHTIKNIRKLILGLKIQNRIQSKVAEKVAYRAFNMASSATIGVVALQQTLPRPKPLTKEQLLKNELAKKEIDKILGGDEQNDWLYPILTDEERDVLSKAVEHNNAFPNGEVK